MKYLQEAGEFLKKREECSSRKRIHFATVWGRLGVSASHRGPLPLLPHQRARDSHRAPRASAKIHAVWAPGANGGFYFRNLTGHGHNQRTHPLTGTRTSQNKGRRPLRQSHKQAVSRLGSQRRGLSLPTRPRTSSPAAPAPFSLTGHPSPSQTAGQEASRVLPLRQRERQAGTTVPRGRLDRRSLWEIVSTEGHRHASGAGISVSARSAPACPHVPGSLRRST